jgi:outer membrane protein assembly factor BamB
MVFPKTRRKIEFMNLSTASVSSYGSWKSSVHAAQVASGSISFQELIYDGNYLYCTENRPREKGRSALVQYVHGQWQDLLPEASLRTRVHEYGGGCVASGDGKIYFTNDKDGRFYCLDSKGNLTLLISQNNLRFADGVVSLDQKNLFLVCEDHQEGGQVDNYLVSLSLEPPYKLKKIASGQNFYSSPRISPDGNYLAFISWDFPNMPWDGTTLYV